MCPGAPLIHHLFFVDDSLLYGNASEEECRRYHTLLSLYERASVQKYKFTGAMWFLVEMCILMLKLIWVQYWGYNVWKSMIVI
jgi:hypothetical protein